MLLGEGAARCIVVIVELWWLHSLEGLVVAMAVQISGGDLQIQGFVD